MIWRTLSKLAFICAALSLNAAPPTLEQMNIFYNQFLGEADIPADKGQNQALLDFTNQHFMIWDYLVDVPSGDSTKYAAHFNTLKQMVVNREMGRAIIFIRDPSHNEYFEYDNTAQESFITAMNDLYNTMQSINPNFYISVFFEDDIDSGDWQTNAPAGTAPTVNPLPTGYFPNLKAKLDWAKAVIAAVPGIKEVAFDPDDVKGQTPRQQIYNYADEYKYLNGMQDIKLGSTVGVEESKETYTNIYPAPVPTVFTHSISAGTYPKVTPAGNPSWRSSNSDSILQSVYIQVYSRGTANSGGSLFPAMFKAGASSGNGHDGLAAATIFNQLLRDYPYLTGVGKITWDQATDLTLTGTGTNFLTWVGLPIIHAFDSRIGKVNKIGEVASVPTTNTTATMGTLPVGSSGNNEAFTRTEIGTAWDTPQQSDVTDLSQDMLDKVYWMFSVNYQPSKYLEFFGNWQLHEFMLFIQNMVRANNGQLPNTAPAFMQGTSTPLQFRGDHCVIYDFDFATTVVGGGVNESGHPINWNLLQAGHSH